MTNSTPDSSLLTDEAVEEIKAALESKALLFPLRIENWHQSITEGGWYIKDAQDRIVMTVAFVDAERGLSLGALMKSDGNTPAKAVVTFLNAIPALCATVKQLRAERDEAVAYSTRLEHNEHLHLDGINRLVANVNDLQSQLEQLRAEKEELRRELETEYERQAKVSL